MRCDAHVVGIRQAEHVDGEILVSEVDVEGRPRPHRQGIAQKPQLKQARVKERLALLELPEQLWPRIAAGEIPAGAIAPLLALAKIHPGLPKVAATLVLDRRDVRYVATVTPPRGCLMR